MNAELRDRWIAALESGEYAKGRSCLRKDDEFCCLGVLAQIDGILVSPSGSDLWGVVDHDYGDEVYEDFLPDADAERFGLDGTQPELARLNDASETFEPVIAKIRELFPDSEQDR